MDIKADDYFAELENLFYRTNDVDIAEIYDIFSHIFTRIADDCTRELKILFSGQFAKVDYLLKQNNISSELSYRIHDLRIRLKDTTKFNQNQLIELCPHDLQTLCEFIADIFSAHIPAELQKHFPLVTRKISGRKLAAEYFRIVVSGWDRTYIYGTAEYNDLNEVKICYNFSDKYSLGDWTYIEPMLSEGCQLNIIKPRIANEIYYPELIIFEPDYLIDISQIAACFESYGHSPEQYLLNKIKLYPNTKYILLGNLAGQFLDEEIHNLDKDVRYEDSINRFFKKNAINFATCCELDGSFHEEARRQQQYIRNTVRNALKESVKTFDIEKVLLEPSFFSEELGIQGRMDLLLNDNTVLIEQKSGKANTFSSDSDVPQPQEKHLVQLLLYMALIHYNYGLRNENIYAFLLYSKYAKSLVKCSPAPKELFEAFKLRNEIVANELSYPQGTMSQLLDITPDSLNIKCNYGFFWERYQEPQIQEVLAPLHNAISLEQKYYLQFMKFIATEHILSKIGNRQQPASGFAALWNSSLAEKHLAGNIYDSLSICNKKTGDDGITTITLKIPESDTFDNPNFRVGDVVILYRYNSTEIPDARKTMVHRASIEDITNEEITLLLRAAQRNESVFDTPKNYKWAVEHDFIDSSYNAQYKAMQMFLLTTEDRRDLILAQRMPEVDKSVSLNNDYGNDDFNTLVLKAKQAKDYFIIIGPPGAGKTSYGMLNVLKEELSEPDGTVLVVSFTNRAVDEVCSKLVENNIDFMRIGTKLSCAMEYRPFLMENKLKSCRNITSIRQAVAQTRVIVGTTTSLSSNTNLFDLKKFSLAIIDEASQILEPHLLAILSAKNGNEVAVRKFVMIGDHKQLPAVVQQEEYESAVDDEVLTEIGLTNCRLSLFERLLRLNRDNDDIVHLLSKQGRMHTDIAFFTNQAFYNGKLGIVPLPHQTKELSEEAEESNGIARMLKTSRVAFVEAELPEHSVSEKVNQNEADIIAATIKSIFEIEKDRFDADKTVGVIVPYRNQISAVRKTVQKLGIEALNGITIDTVERFQGSQRDYIIYGFTVQKIYQLNFLTSNVFTDTDGVVIDRKLNVALTRAREHMIITGNSRLLSKNSIFSKLLSYIKKNGTYIEVSKENYCNGNF